MRKAGALTVVLLFALLLFSLRKSPSKRRNLEPDRSAFAETYLDPARGKVNLQPRDCLACHENRRELSPETWNSLAREASQSRRAWAANIQLNARCGACHLTPDPSNLPTLSWTQALGQMARIMQAKNVPALSNEERLRILHFYYAFSRDEFPLLPEDPDFAPGPRRFESSEIGFPRTAAGQPVIGHVQVVDLDRDGSLDVLVCDTQQSSVNWIHRIKGVWTEEPLAKVPCPAHTQIVTNSTTGALDIVVAAQNVMAATDDPVGSVVLLHNDGHDSFTTNILVVGLPRVVDVEPADFNRDGQTDFVVAAYGLITQGEVGWLRRDRDHYEYKTILQRTGAIHVLPVDLNGDGAMDFVALFAQEHEQISAFLNDGAGNFQERVLFQAATPCFGSSGIQLVDLDQDGDLDILYTNGDNMDLPTMIPRPYHGVQWLENKGNLQFVWHDIGRFYGAYCAVAGDLDGDGKIDVVATSMFNQWSNPKRASLIWFQNDGRQNFTPHALARAPIYLLSATLGDLDGDGALDIVASGMHAYRPYERMGRVTLWTSSRK